VFKTLAFLVRRPDLPRAEFARHYEEVHVPLALPALPGLERYVRNHLAAGAEAPEAFDCMTEFWYASAEHAQRVASAMRSDAGRAIRADELAFMDKPRNRSFAVEERVLRRCEPEGPAAPRETLIALFGADARGPGFDALVERELPQLLRGAAAPAACGAQRVLEAFTGQSQPLGAVVTLSPGAAAPARAQLEAWARSQGALAALWSRRCETPRSEIDALRRPTAGGGSPAG